MLEDDLADEGRFGFNNFLDKGFSIINQWGTLGPRVILHDFKLYFSQQSVGTIHRRKCGLRGLLTSASVFLGGLLPTVIFPNLGLELQAVFLQVMGFLPGASYASAVLTVSLLCAMMGAMVSGAILDYCFNRYYNTPHTKLVFTEAEIKELLSNPQLKEALDCEHAFVKTIDFLQKEFAYKLSKYPKLKQHIKILDIADRLRSGDIKKLQKHLKKKLLTMENALGNSDEVKRLDANDQTAVFLRSFLKDPKWQKTMLIKLLDELNSAQLKETEQSRAAELLLLLSNPNQVVDDDLTAEQPTPVTHQQKSKKKTQRKQEMEVLFQTLQPNTRPKVTT